MGHLSRYLNLWTLGLLALIQATATFTLALLRHYDLKSSLMDNGVFMQALWTFIHTGAPTIAINPPYEPFPWLGFHFSPLVLALAPLYALFPAAELLLAVQSLAIASTPFAVAAACRALGATPQLAIGWGMLYLIHPFVFNAAVWDFHEVALAAPIMAWAFYGLVARRFRFMVVFLVLLALTKEHYGVAVAGFGLAWGLLYGGAERQGVQADARRLLRREPARRLSAHVNKEWKRAAPLVALGFALLPFLTLWAMPAISGLAEHPMLSTKTIHFNRYAWATLPLPEMAWELFLILISPNSVLYLGLLLAPLLLLPLRAFPLLLPLAADGVVNIISYASMQKSIYSYHSVAMVAPLLVAACAGSLKATANNPPERLHQLMTCAIITLALMVASAPFPPGTNVWELQHASLHPPKELNEVQQYIAPNEPLSIQANLGAYFANRDYIAPFPLGLQHADTILLHMKYPFLTQDSPFGAPYGGVISTEEYMNLIRQLIDHDGYGVVYAKDGWAVLKKGALAMQNAQLAQWADEVQRYYDGLPRSAPPKGWWKNPQPRRAGGPPTLPPPR